MQHENDETGALIRAAQSGSREDFARLIENHYDLMFRFAMKYAGHRADAEDITQQACIKVGRFIGQFRFESAFSTWLYRLVINCARDWYKRRREVGVEEHPEPFEESSGEVMVQLGELMLQIEAMGEGFRDAVVLVLGEGLTHSEAAEVLEVKESTVSWRIHEVRNRLDQESVS